jgi:hypothetical protein
MTRLTKEQLSAHLRGLWDLFRQRVRRYLLSMLVATIERLQALHARIEGLPEPYSRYSRPVVDRHYHLSRR